MNFYVTEMTEEYARQIAAWQYPPPYDIYSFSDNAYEIDELQNGLHFAVLSDLHGKMPCGFAAIGWSAQIQDPALREIYDDESYTDIAFGLRPDLCGRGIGAAFVESVIGFTRSLFEEEGIRLTVAADNKRACRLYEKLGFQELHAFETDSADAVHHRKMRMIIMIL